MVFISMKIKLFIILSIVTFPLGMETAIAKRPIIIANHPIEIANHPIIIAQPRQTPTANFVKRIIKTSTLKLYPL